MAQVNTVLGPIHPDELGITLAHEHIQFGPPGWEFAPESWASLPRVFETINNDLLDLRSIGGKTLVCCSGIGLGRDVDFYVNLSRSSGVHIVASTGFWAEQGISPFFALKDIDYHEEMYVTELTKGMERTMVKAGVIKVGNSRDEFTPIEEVTYRAAARASRRTGCAIITHGVNFARRQAEIMVDEEKADPGRIIISHLDARYSLDLERDKEFCRRGLYVGYDHIGTEDIWSPTPYAMPDDKRVELVKAMLDAGFVKNVIISNDTNGHSTARPTQLHTYAHLQRYFLPKLQRVGVSEEDIHIMLVENPKRLLPF